MRARASDRDVALVSLEFCDPLGEMVDAFVGTIVAHFEVHLFVEREVFLVHFDVWNGYAALWTDDA